MPVAIEVRTPAALGFLRNYAPGGPWKLSAIRTGEQKLPTETFGPETEPAAAAFIEKRNKGGAGIYFETALSEGKPNKKSLAADIVACRSISLDIDCGPDRVREVIDALLNQRFKSVPVPNLIVDSGGGVWSHWMLSEPADPETVRAILKGLIEVFAPLGADMSCHNPDRIARLPGTTNTKPGIGRLATWLPTSRAEPYDIDEFKSFAGAPGRGDPGPLAEKATGAANTRVVPVADLSDLGLDPEGDDWLGAVLVTGYPKAQLEAGLVEGTHPVKGCGFDRSGVVFSAACELVRRGVDPGKIAGALTNRDWGISAHVYDNPPADRYALKQVHSAIEAVVAAEEETVRNAAPPPDYPGARKWLNARFATVDNYGGKFRVMARPGVDDPTLPAFLEDTQWARRFNGHLVERTGPDGSRALVPLAKAWLHDRARASYSRVIFDPAGDDPDPRSYNLWTDYVAPNPPTDCAEYLALTREVIAGGDEDVAEYVLNWMAHLVQKPGEKIEVAIALRGGQGLGKSLWVELFGELFGPHFVGVSGAEGLASKFNKHLQLALLVFGDEMNAAGDKATVSRLKTLVTQTHIQIEPKGVDAFTSPNRFALIVASNDDRVVQIDPDDRRWLALDVDPCWKGDLDRFDRLVRGWRAGGREAFLELLLARDLDNFNFRIRPLTASHTDQVRRSFGGAMGVVHAMLDRGETPGIDRGRERYDCPTRTSGEVFVPTGDLLRWARDNRLVGPGDGNVETALGRELANASPYRKTLRFRVEGRQVRGVWLASLSEARRLWAKAHGLDLDWTEIEADWDVSLPAGVDAERGEVPF